MQVRTHTHTPHQTSSPVYGISQNRTSTTSAMVIAAHCTSQHPYDAYSVRVSYRCRHRCLLLLSNRTNPITPNPSMRLPRPPKIVRNPHPINITFPMPYAPCPTITPTTKKAKIRGENHWPGPPPHCDRRWKSWDITRCLSRLGRGYPRCIGR